MNKGERIKHLREAKGITQEELAKLLNTTKQTVSKYEKNIVTNIPSDRIEELSHILDTTPSYLMGWDIVQIEAAAKAQSDADAYDDEHEKELNDFMNELGSEFDFKQFERIKKYANALKSAMNVNIESFDELHQSYVELFQKMYELNLSEAELNDVYRYACFIKSKR